MIGRPGHRMMEMNGGGTVSYLVPRVPFSMLILNRSGSKGAFGFPGATWDRFRCTVEPSPGHIRYRCSAAKKHSPVNQSFEPAISNTSSNFFFARVLGVPP